MRVIDVKPATTLREAADQMEEAMSFCKNHYVHICNKVLSQWSMVCRAVDVDELLKLADEMEHAIDVHHDIRAGRDLPHKEVREYVNRIREAFGVDSNH